MSIRNGHDPTCLGAHTRLPLDYACQEAAQHTTMHKSTASQLARLTLNSTPPKYS